MRCWTAKAGEFLQGVKRLAVAADQRLQITADNRDYRPIVLDVEIDVAVIVDDVEQPLEVIGGDISFAHKQIAI